MSAPEIRNVYAEVAVSDHAASVEWYAALFGRRPDRQPMDGLAEWDLSSTGGLQVFARPERAGGCLATFMVDTVGPIADHLATLGIETDVQTVSSGFAVAVVDDPDGNSITFAGSRAEP